MWTGQVTCEKVNLTFPRGPRSTCVYESHEKWFWPVAFTSTSIDRLVSETVIDRLRIWLLRRILRQTHERERVDVDPGEGRLGACVGVFSCFLLVFASLFSLRYSSKLFCWCFSKKAGMLTCEQAARLFQISIPRGDPCPSVCLDSPRFTQNHKF